jgi:gas vesicle protein
MNERQNTPAGAASDPAGAGNDPAQRVDDAAQRVKDRTAEAGRDVSQAANEVKEKVAATAEEVGGRVKEQAQQAGAKLKEQSLGFLNEQKGRAATEIQAYSGAARRAAERLQEESDLNLAGYVTTAADRLDQFGRHIQERDLGQLVEDVEGMARRRPEIFFGAMFVAGLAAARFLKASRERRQRDQYGDRQLAIRRPEMGMPGGNFGAGGSTEVSSRRTASPGPDGLAGSPTTLPGQAGGLPGGTL